MTTMGSGYGVPSVTARYSGPTVCQRSDHSGSSDPTAVKSVHFNTVHNCEQLAADRAPPRYTQLSKVDEDPPQAPGLTTPSLTAADVGQSLPASYRCRSATADPSRPAAAQVLPSTPTATINRYYAAQPRTLYPSGLGTPPAATVCRDGGEGGLVSIGSRAHILSPQCSVSDGVGANSPPASRLRHYCV